MKRDVGGTVKLKLQGKLNFQQSFSIVPENSGTMCQRRLEK
jgi:hypothetical protein